MTNRMIRHDAEEAAGQYYEANRTDVFRAHWPDQMEYVNSQWPHFIERVRKLYAEMLNWSHVPQEDKDKIYDALIEEGGQARAMDAHDELQITPDSAAANHDRSDLIRINMEAVEAGEYHRAAKRALLRSTRARK